MEQETRALINEVASQAAREAVREAFLVMGVDPDDPISTQRDIAALRELRELVDDKDWQADMLHLRKWRKTMDSVQTKGVMTIVGMVVAGIFAGTWLGFKGLIGAP